MDELIKLLLSAPVATLALCCLALVIVLAIKGLPLLRRNRHRIPQDCPVLPPPGGWARSDRVETLAQRLHTLASEQAAFKLLAEKVKRLEDKVEGYRQDIVDARISVEKLAGGIAVVNTTVSALFDKVDQRFEDGTERMRRIEDAISRVEDWQHQRTPPR